jgi:ABC-2 type transport system permease protein
VRVFVVEQKQQRSERPPLSAQLRCVWILCWREIIRFFRQRNRVVGAVGQPILFWLLFGAGMNRTFQIPGQSFSNYYIPGTLVLILLFTAIFATISIIEDRNEGFLQSVLVAPVPRWSVVAGKLAGGACIAVVQGWLFFLLTLTLGVRLGWLSTIQLFLFMVAASIALTGLGFLIAWRLDSTQGFHAIMNLLLMPMWLLSGAFFPVPRPGESSGAVELGLHWLMRLNPVTYVVAGIRSILLGPGVAALESVAWIPALTTCWVVTIGFTVVMCLMAWRGSRQRVVGDNR